MIGEPTSNRSLAALSRGVVEGSETVSAGGLPSPRLSRDEPAAGRSTAVKGAYHRSYPASTFPSVEAPAHRQEHLERPKCQPSPRLSVTPGHPVLSATRENRPQATVRKLTPLAEPLAMSATREN